MDGMVFLSPLREVGKGGVMALVDVEYDTYKCPHCGGTIVVRMQYYFDGGTSYSIKHVDEDGEEVELEIK